MPLATIPRPRNEFAREKKEKKGKKGKKKKKKTCSKAAR
jgi:hypothetical protein